MLITNRSLRLFRTIPRLDNVKFRLVHTLNRFLRKSIDKRANCYLLKPNREKAQRGRYRYQTNVIYDVI